MLALNLYDFGVVSDENEDIVEVAGLDGSIDKLKFGERFEQIAIFPDCGFA